jgi:predicted ABC-type ATPase
MVSDLRLLIFAGPNGSGKSTFTTPEILDGFGISRDRYINADDITRELSALIPNATQTEKEWAAFYEARKRRQTYREQRISFAFETVFSHPSTFLDIQSSRELGFEIIIIFVTTKDSAINVERVSRRFLSGGHNVDTDKIISRYNRTMSFLPRIVEEADYTFVYDNSSDRPIQFSFVRDGYEPKKQIFPSFLERKLVNPLGMRRSEIIKIRDSFNSVQSPIILSSEYHGEIVWCRTHYMIQSTVNGLIKHDLCLFTKLESQILTGMHINIIYKDGVGVLA